MKKSKKYLALILCVSIMLGAAECLAAGSSGQDYMPIDGVEGAKQLIPRKTEANSYIGPGSSYQPSSATDGEDDTCWQFSMRSVGNRTATLVLFFQSGSTLDELWIKNGYWKNTGELDQYIRNSRPKEIAISFLYDGQSTYQNEVLVELADDTERKDWQIVPLGRQENVKAVRIRIISIYEGTIFSDSVAISEVMFVERATSRQLRLGDSGVDVLEMKLRLQVLGYYPAAAGLSNKFNETCKERVKQFQKNNGLAATGVADPYTLTVLFSPEAIGAN